MAKVKTQHFRHTGKTGEKIEFKSDITVDSDGDFHATIPAELYESAERMLGTDTWDSAKRNSGLWPGIVPSKAKVNHRIGGKVLENIERFISAAMIEHLACEVTEDLVIIYTHECKTKYVYNDDGEFGRNGYAFDGRPYYFGGNDSVAAHQAVSKYSIAVGAKCVKRITYTRPSGVKVVFDRPDFPNNHHRSEHPGEMLNEFIALYPEGAKCQVIPYSDEAAMFFVNLLTAMCKMSHQLDHFLGNEDNLRLAIARGGATALTFNPTPKD